jgi:hypothetical protein
MTGKSIEISPSVVIGGAHRLSSGSHRASRGSDNVTSSELNDLQLSVQIQFLHLFHLISDYVYADRSGENS